MDQNIIRTITNKIDGILKSVEQEKAELQQKQAEAQAAASEARSRMEAATASADTATYHTAKQDETVAATAVEMYNQRLSQISGKHLVSDEENADVVAAIRAEQKKLEKATTRQIIALLKEIEKLGKDYYNQQDELNKLIARWHEKVYEQPHRLGPRFKLHSHELCYNDTDLRTAIHKLVTMYFYREKTGREQYHGKGSIFM